MNRNVFDELFVLEMANNHWGDVARGLKIIKDFSRIVRFNNVRAAIKLQLRDVDTFIHPDWRARTDIRYIGKTMATRLTPEQYGVLVNAIRKSGCIPMATPFDEASVDLCQSLNIPIIKLASSDINDWVLIERIAALGKPMIISTGGSSLKDTDDLVQFCERRNIQLAINHCVSIYPSEDEELELNQIDYLRNRYPNHVIGWSSHEHTDWCNSILIAYAKGARTFERHVDITGDKDISPYCSTPNQVDTWFKAFNKAKQMCGASGDTKRIPPAKEIAYLNSLVRGVYARHKLKAGAMLTEADYYLAIPLQRGQISCRELMTGEVLLHDVAQDAPIMIDAIDSPYAGDNALIEMVRERGICE